MAVGWRLVAYVRLIEKRNGDERQHYGGRESQPMIDAPVEPSRSQIRPPDNQQQCQTKSGNKKEDRIILARDPQTGKYGAQQQRAGSLIVKSPQQEIDQVVACPNDEEERQRIGAHVHGDSNHRDRESVRGGGE